MLTKVDLSSRSTCVTKYSLNYSPMCKPPWLVGQTSCHSSFSGPSKSYRRSVKLLTNWSFLPRLASIRSSTFPSSRARSGLNRFHHLWFLTCRHIRFLSRCCSVVEPTAFTQQNKVSSSGPTCRPSSPPGSRSSPCVNNSLEHRPGVTPVLKSRGMLDDA